MKQTLGNPLPPPPKWLKIAKHSMSTCTSHQTFKPTYKLVQPTYKLYWGFLIHKLCLNNFNRSCNSKTVSHPSFKRIKSHCCLLQCTHHVLPSQYNMLITPNCLKIVCKRNLRGCTKFRRLVQHIPPRSSTSCPIC